MYKKSLIWNEYEYSYEYIWDATFRFHTIMIRPIDTSGISQLIWLNIDLWET